MEPTTKLKEAVDNPRSRRVLLAGAVGGLAAWLAAAAQRAMPAEASAGDPVLAGRSNSGGGFSTELRANTTKPTFRAVQLGGGNALRGEATTGRGVVGIGGSQGTGLWGYSPDHYGLHTRTETGTRGLCGRCGNWIHRGERTGVGKRRDGDLVRSPKVRRTRTRSKRQGRANSSATWRSSATSRFRRDRRPNQAPIRRSCSLATTAWARRSFAYDSAPATCRSSPLSPKSLAVAIGGGSFT